MSIFQIGEESESSSDDPNPTRPATFSNYPVDHFPPASSHPVPDLSHIETSDYGSRIYEPSADTYLLMDCLSADITFLADLRPKVCLEVGSGSGAVLTQLACMLKSHVSNPPWFIATDINSFAANVTEKTLHIANVPFHTVVLADVVHGLRLVSKVDIAIFNPPYVETGKRELAQAKGLALAWAGGVKGREVTDRALPFILASLRSGGIMYLVTITVNAPEELAKYLRNLGHNVAEVARKTVPGEMLVILRIIKS